VKAAGVNPLDYHFMRGSPYILRLMGGIGAPEDPRAGVDFAGVVEAVGTEVTEFVPGDEVFGGAKGAYAEYVMIPESRAIVKKPDNVSFEQAAGVAIAGITALQALEDKGELEAGQDVLINGLGWRWHLRHPDRKGDGCQCQRRLQHAQRRHGRVDRR
jgi:NADPH:quinone reductase-like Zn-dependent oxidoreductase